MAKKPVQSESSTKLWVKVVCGIMGFLMVFGVLTMLFSTFRSVATENSNLATRADQQISVGLYCNENAVQSYTLQAEQGFSISSSLSNFAVKTKESLITAAVDDNLYRVGNQLSTQAVGVATVGGYHIEIEHFAFSDLGIDTDHDNPVYIRPGNTTVVYDGYTSSNVNDYIDILSTNSAFKALNLHAFAFYASNEKCYIRVGEFFTAEEAALVLEQLNQAMILTAKVVSPDSDNVTLLSKDYTILCELEGKNQTFYLTAQNQLYMTDNSDRYFSGSIAISRPDTAAQNGLAITNQLSLEAYIAALLPSEVADTWNFELLKTMAIVLRTEVTRKLGCHSKEGFDICVESHCHSYIGGSIASDTILQAVQETAGQILTYEDRPIYTPYSLTNGSGTISSKDAFGTDLPYLPAIYTPWENTTDWTVEFAPFELYRLLTNAGYGEIQGNIASIEILSLVEGSDYVSELRFTDLFGSTVTVSGSEAIRTLFGGKLPSACFIVGKAGEEVTRTKRVLTDDGLDYTESVETITLTGTYESFVFVGRGSGCGVGFSIYGALALSDIGLTYDEILDCYFPGTVLTGKMSE